MYCGEGCVEGPTAVYDGEGSANDGAGALNAVQAPVDYAGGHAGRAFSFGGNRGQNYVELPSEVGDFGPGNFTISLWFNSGYVDGNQAMIARRLTCTGARDFAGYDVRLGNTGRLNVELWTTVNHYVLGSDAGLERNDSGWHHLAIVRQGSQVRLVVDGVVEGTSAIAGSMSDPYHTPTYLGVGSCVANAPRPTGGDGTHWFDGLLDEVAFFRRALTAAEITATVEGRCSR